MILCFSNSCCSLTGSSFQLLKFHCNFRGLEQMLVWFTLMEHWSFSCRKCWGMPIGKRFIMIYCRLNCTLVAPSSVFFKRKWLFCKIWHYMNPDIFLIGDCIPSCQLHDVSLYERMLVRFSFNGYIDIEIGLFTSPCVAQLKT